MKGHKNSKGKVQNWNGQTCLGVCACVYVTVNMKTRIL